MGTNPALEKWAARALRDVTLPSGTRVRLRVPQLDEMIRNGAMPEGLRKVVVQHVSGTPVETIDEGRIFEFFDTSDYLIAQIIEQVHGDQECDERPCRAEHWEAAELTVDSLRALRLPAEDTQAARDIAWRTRTPEQVTATSLRTLGLLSAEREQAVQRREAAATVTGWSDFRGERGSAGTGDAGPSVGQSSE